MKALLTAIQTQLRTDLTTIRDSDIYIAPHENYIPNQVRPPCVGIKDGRIVRKELTGGMMEVTLDVTIAIFVHLAKDEASIMGDTATGKKGVLEIGEDVGVGEAARVDGVGQRLWMKVCWVSPVCRRPSVRRKAEANYSAMKRRPCRES